jgi:aspartyl protease
MAYCGSKAVKASYSRKIRFVVDTGAMRTVLMYDEGEALNLNVERLGKPTHYQGVGGKVAVYPLDDVHLYLKGWNDEGNEELHKSSMNLGIMDIHTKGFFNLLGLDFFIQNKATLHIDCDSEEYYIEIPE